MFFQLWSQALSSGSENLWRDELVEFKYESQMGYSKNGGNFFGGAGSLFGSNIAAVYGALQAISCLTLLEALKASKIRRPLAAGWGLGGRRRRLWTLDLSGQTGNHVERAHKTPTSVTEVQLLGCNTMACSMAASESGSGDETVIINSLTYGKWMRFPVWSRFGIQSMLISASAFLNSIGNRNHEAKRLVFPSDKPPETPCKTMYIK